MPLPVGPSVPGSRGRSIRRLSLIFGGIPAVQRIGASFELSVHAASLEKSLKIEGKGHTLKGITLMLSTTVFRQEQKEKAALENAGRASPAQRDREVRYHLVSH